MYQATNIVQFVYDGWNLIQETSTAGITNSYVWGQDLSQSLQGAGGIGGLLAVIRSDTNSLQPTVYYPCFDGNGNISDYVDANGVVVAHREYDPFGNTVVSTGPMKDSFSFWFSTKYYEPWWKLYYYGYRWYSPSLHIWLSSDPLMDPGSVGAVMFKNYAIRKVDDFTMLLTKEWMSPNITLEQRQILAGWLNMAGQIREMAVYGDPRLSEYFARQNWYQFCGNNPLNLFDPFGLDCEQDRAARDIGNLADFVGAAFMNVGAGSLGGTIIAGGIGAGIGAIFGGVGAGPGAGIGAAIGFGGGTMYGIYRTGEAWEEYNRKKDESRKEYEECLKKEKCP